MTSFNPKPSSSRSLSPSEWQERAEAHRAALAPWLDAHRARRARGENHPVYDFLTTYYSFAPSQLALWTPGAGVRLEGAEESPLFANRRHFSPHPDGGIWVSPAAFPPERGEGLRRALEILRATASRPPNLGCFGLHEWAMLHRPDPADPAAVRHGAARLRLPPEAIAAVVESRRIVCSHFDAFRFFTPAARPLNTLRPAAHDRPAHEQPGCLHANMDLYKWAYKFHPFIPSELLRSTFLLALEIRELDMRASPYDLAPEGFPPVPIETPEGRETYAAQQSDFARRAAPLRLALIAALETLETAQSRQP